MEAGGWSGDRGGLNRNAILARSARSANLENMRGFWLTG